MFKYKLQGKPLSHHLNYYILMISGQLIYILNVNILCSLGL